jgi:hypothetical protein
METNNEKKSTKIIAVLNKDWHYHAHSGREFVEAGRRFECRGGHYINKAGDLVLEHWIQYGAESVIPADHFDLLLEETVTVTTKTVTAKPAKVKGKYIVPADEAAE